MKQVENNTDTVTTMVDQSYLAPAMNDYNDDGGFAPAIGALKEFAKNFTDGDTQTMTPRSTSAPAGRSPRRTPLWWLTALR